MGKTAYLAGLLHDMGKCSGKYQDYLNRAARGEEVVRGSVNHTFCGCIYLLNRYHTGKPQSYGTITCELLVYAMGAHHGQFDCVTPKNTSGFEERLNKDAEEIGYDEAVKSFLASCAPEEEIERLFLLAQHEVDALLQTLKSIVGKGKAQMHFLMGLAARMIFSAVIDGDRRDTAEFMNGAKLEAHVGSERLWASQIEFLKPKWRVLTR